VELGAVLAGRTRRRSVLDGNAARALRLGLGQAEGTDARGTRREGGRDCAPHRDPRLHAGPRLPAPPRDHRHAARLHPLSPVCLRQVRRHGRARHRRGGRGAGDPAGLSDGRGAEGPGQGGQAHKQGRRWLGREGRGAPPRPGTADPRSRSGRPPDKKPGPASASRTSAARRSPRTPLSSSPATATCPAARPRAR